MNNRADDPCEANHSEDASIVEAKAKCKAIKEKFVQNFSLETSGEWTDEYSGSDIAEFAGDTICCSQEDK